MYEKIRYKKGLRGGGNGVKPSGSGYSEEDNYLIPEESHKRKDIINNAMFRAVQEDEMKNVILSESEFADGRRETSPDSEQIEYTVAKQHVRNSESVEQIQDSETIQPIVNQKQLQGNKYAFPEKVFSLFTFHCSQKFINSECCCLMRGEVRKTSRKVAFTFAEGTTHVVYWKNSRKIAFTLAEVIITLGIIGVVAAITIPTLIKNYQKQVTLNKIKRTYTVLNNTLERAKSDYGTEISQWTIPDGTNREKSLYFVENYMLPYLKVLKYCKEYKVNTECGEKALYFAGPNKYEIIAPAGSDFGTNFVLNDGTNVYVRVGQGNGNEAENTKRVLISFDINGVNKGLNTYGYDIFIVELGGYEGYTAKNNADKNRFLPYIYEPQKNCEYYVGSQPHACSKNAQYAAGSACLAYIVCNGWSFGKNYPW